MFEEVLPSIRKTGSYTDPTTLSPRKPLTKHLHTFKGEPRIDSRIIAAELDVTTSNVAGMVDQYAPQFHQFGVIGVQTQFNAREGNSERYYLLNEDQVCFLMTLMRNTEHVVNLKQRLVQAFSTCRQQQHTDSQANVEKLKALLIEARPEYGLIIRCRKAGLTQMQTAGALRWGEKRVRLAEKKLIQAGLLLPVQMSLALEG